MYKHLIRPILFKLDPEKAHELVSFAIRTTSILPFKEKIFSFCGNFVKEKEFMGLKFKNPLGLASGFDKNAELYNVMQYLGFGFIEIGTVTFMPQPGNERPRLFRFPENMAIVNRMGFNNKGAKKVAENIASNGKPSIPLGINIGKNTDCPLENAAENYADCFRILRQYGDFFIINISCPNIKDLRKLHDINYLEKIISRLKNQDSLKPMLIKIAPDIENSDLVNVVKICLKYQMGLIASNTLPAEKAGYSQKGGLSGRPLNMLAMERLKEIREISKEIPIISSGGIFSEDDLNERLKYGANLAEIYTSIIYEGPLVVKKILKSHRNLSFQGSVKS